MNKKNLKKLIRECMNHVKLQEMCGDGGMNLVDKASQHRDSMMNHSQEDREMDLEKEADEKWEQLMTDLGGENAGQLSLQVAKAFANNKELSMAALEMAKGMYDFQQEMFGALKTIEEKQNNSPVPGGMPEISSYPFGVAE